LGQLALPFAHVTVYGPDFLEAGSNAEALSWLARTAAWPGARLALWGRPGSGKTHLLHLWARQAGAVLVPGRSLRARPVTAPLAIDDADGAAVLPLLHTLNAAAEAGVPVLLAGRAPPARWAATLPDLDSRLRAMTAVELGDPEESLLRALLMRLLAERQLAVPEALQDWMLLRLPRTATAIREAAARLDHASMLSGRRPNRALAGAVVAAIHEVSEADRGPASPAGPVIL
jgi:chromosomal replication initiation ATPase DnaA